MSLIQNLTPEEYLRQERLAEFKSEYIRGEIRAMSGVRLNHARIVTNLHRLFGPLTRQFGGECVSSDLRVTADANSSYFYPDFVVICGEPEFIDNQMDTLLNPVLLVEVLSPSTADYDRSRKWQAFRQIPSLQHYLLLDSSKVSLDMYTRVENDVWTLQGFSKLEEEIDIKLLQAKILLGDLYDRVDLAELDEVEENTTLDA